MYCRAKPGPTRASRRATLSVAWAIMLMRTAISGGRRQSPVTLTLQSFLVVPACPPLRRPRADRAAALVPMSRESSLTAAASGRGLPNAQTAAPPRRRRSTRRRSCHSGPGPAPAHVAGSTPSVDGPRRPLSPIRRAEAASAHHPLRSALPLALRAQSPPRGGKGTLAPLHHAASARRRQHPALGPSEPSPRLPPVPLPVPSHGLAAGTPRSSQGQDGDSAHTCPPGEGGDEPVEDAEVEALLLGSSRRRRQRRRRRAREQRAVAAAVVQGHVRAWLCRRRSSRARCEQAREAPTAADPHGDTHPPTSPCSSRGGSPPPDAAPPIPESRAPPEESGPEGGYSLIDDRPSTAGSAPFAPRSASSASVFSSTTLCLTRGVAMATRVARGWRVARARRAAHTALLALCARAARLLASAAATSARSAQRRVGARRIGTWWQEQVALPRNALREVTARRTKRTAWAAAAFAPPEGARRAL